MKTTGFAGVAALAICSTPAFGMTVGQPLLVIEDNISVFLLNDFGSDGIPDDFFEVSANGDISSVVGGNPALVGQGFSFQTRLNFDDQLTLGPQTPIFNFMSGFDRFLLTDLQADAADGVLSFEYETYFDTALGTPHPTDPALTEFEFLAPFAEFGPIATGASPDQVLLTLGIDIHLDSPLPTRTQMIDIGPPFGVVDLTFVEGQLDVSKIVVGKVGGPPAPAVVPLPGTLPIMLGGLAALAFVRGKRAT